MTVATSVRGLRSAAPSWAASRSGTSPAAPAPPVVLLHGLGGGALNWVELLPALAERYRVVVLDLPGHGRSGRLPPRAAMAAYADVVAALIEHEQAAPALRRGPLVRRPRRPTPGAAAPRARPRPAARRPRRHRLRHPRRAGRRSSRPASSGRAAGSLLSGIGTPRGTGTGGRSSGPWFVSDALSLSPRRDGRLPRGRDASTRTSVPPGGRSSATTRGATSSRSGVRSSIVWGARDPQLPLDDAFEFTRRLRAKLRVVADCGHLVIGERPASLSGRPRRARAPLGSAHGGHACAPCETTSSRTGWARSGASTSGAWSRTPGCPVGAEEKAARDIASVLPEGLATPEHASLDRRVGGVRCGHACFSAFAPGGAWLYDITIDEGARGRGYGRAAMTALEEQARSLGFDSIGLNVWGGNDSRAGALPVARLRRGVGADAQAGLALRPGSATSRNSQSSSNLTESRSASACTPRRSVA